MVMKVLGGIIAAAAAALVLYHRAMERSPSSTNESVGKIRQVTSVVAGIVLGIVSILDALLGLHSATKSLSAQGGRIAGLGEAHDYNE